MTMPEPLGVDERERARWGPVDKSPERSIELKIPARPELWGLARMAVASVASRLGFDFEEIEDLRLAVDELSIACARETSSASLLRLSCHWSTTGLYLECRVAPVSDKGNDNEEGGLPKGFSQRELSENILDALVDAHGICPAEEGARMGWLRKTARATPGQ